MIKAKEVASADSCLNRAEVDEPIFVLRAHDKLAPGAVRAWAAERGRIRGYDATYEEAMALADQMEEWRRTHG